MHPLDEKSKNLIAKKLSNRLGVALENGEIVLDDLEESIDMILAAMDTIKTKEDLLAFLTKLSASWPFFMEILDSESKQEEALTEIEHAFASRNSIQYVGMAKA